MVEAIVEVTITEVTEAEVDTTKTVGVIIPEATRILADATEEIQTEGSIIRKNLRNLPQVRLHFFTADLPHFTEFYRTQL